MDNYSINGDLRQEAFKKPSLKEVSILYSISVIVLMFLATRVQRQNTYIGLIITEVVLILPMPLILLFISKYDFKKVLRLNGISVTNLLLIFGIMVFAYFPVSFLNQYYLILIKVIFGHVAAASIAPAQNPVSLLINILIVGVSAGVCEETLFRGTIMRGFERFGPRFAIIFTGFLFGMWHMYFTSLFFATLLGILLGYIVYRTNSVIGGMFAHFCNNTISVVIGFIAFKVTKGTQTQNIDKVYTELLNGPTEKLVAFFASSAFMILASGAVLAGLLIAFHSATKGTAPKILRENNRGTKRNMFWLVPGLIFIAFTYTAMGLSFAGIKIPVIRTIAKIIGLA